MCLNAVVCSVIAQWVELEALIGGGRFESAKWKLCFPIFVLSRIKTNIIKSILCMCLSNSTITNNYYVEIKEIQK